MYLSDVIIFSGWSHKIMNLPDQTITLPQDRNVAVNVVIL